MTWAMRDMFANVRPEGAVTAAAAITAETLQNLLAISLDTLLQGEQSVAVQLAGILAPGTGNGQASISIDWQQADDAGFSVNAELVPGHETVAAAIVQTSAGNRKFRASLPLNLQFVTRAFVRARVTVVSNGDGTHSTNALYLIGGEQTPPVERTGLGL